MELINNTPFVPLQYESVDKQLNLFGTTVIRGTFDITSQRRLTISDVQEKPVLIDEYFDDSRASGLRYQNSLVPYKPRTDLLIEATAYAPGGKPAQNWEVGVTAGPINKRFQVTGPRWWERKMGLFVPNEIEPVKSVEVRYEHAFGGGGVEEAPDPQNPVGVGRQENQELQQIPCPRMLPLGINSPRFGQPIPVQGLGPLAPSWQPRLGHAGTHDDQWLQTRAPYQPLDFDFLFYNAAPADQIFPGFAAGHELIHLHNLTPDGELNFSLPGIEMIHIIQFDDGRLIPAPIKLDTIHIVVEQRKVFLEWRGIYPLHIPIKRMEIRLSALDYVKAA